ncbi:transcriptional regulator, MarR family [Anaerovirgula multivorans]|uniref:HTH-type transcriptional regulator MgrA n=1 Tax=Anaerovirgula multivorans TaxID=312168 RepID=A0A239E953_9FIRM|nr:MarR family transcriptional regulator [Anaerovirgula multivorans]SNS40563.1 transcriptional regulator, MarR family [Anaerovirgula multivorans]
MDVNSLYDLFFENIKKLFYPEEWIKLDLSFSKSEIFTMLLVDKHGEIIMSQIAEDIHIPMSTATGMVERLVKLDYLSRERSELDRRIVVIKLTDKGKALINQLKEMVSHYIHRISESLTKEEIDLLSKIFMKVIHIINDVGEEQKHAENQEKKDKIKKIEIE